MAAPDAITCDRLAKLVGTPRCPALLDVRAATARAEDARLVPGARPLDDEELTPDGLAAIAPTLAGPVVTICAEGHRRSQGAAALLRSHGLTAEYLEGGHAAWAPQGLPLIDPGKIAARDRHGRSVWVTRSRPKIDRIACPWLIRRFVDPRAVFLFVAPAEVEAWPSSSARCPTTSRACSGAIAANTAPSTRWSTSSACRPPGARSAGDHRPRGGHGAARSRAGGAGLLAASLGLSRMYADDLEQLEAGMALYDAFYRWARDATDETHNWPANRPRAAR